MKKLIIFAALLFCASICWGQYSTTWQPGVTDITGYLPTTNAWRPLGGGGVCWANTLSVGADGYAICINGFPYTYSMASRNWSQLTSMGNQMHRVIVGDAAHIYALGPGGCNSVGSYNIFFWTGSAWTAKPGCLVQMAVALDNSIVGVNQLSDAWQSLDGGNSWTQLTDHTRGPTLTYVSAADKYSICGVGGNTIYTTATGTTFSAMTPQPGGTPVGCAIAQGDPALLVWDASGAVKTLDYATTGTWINITGAMGGGLSVPAKAMILGLDSGGHPYHLNVYASWMYGTTSGSVNGCPGPNDQCPQGVTHNGTLAVTYPHGICHLNPNDLNCSGQFSQPVKAAPTANLSVSAWDFSPMCDPFIGDPNDSECVTISSGNVQCSATGALFQGNGGAPQPPNNPPGYTIHKSIDIKSWDGHAPTIFESHSVLNHHGWFARAACNLINTCAAGSYPTCPFPDSAARVADLCTGDACSPGETEDKAAKRCNDIGLPFSQWYVSEYHTDANGIPVVGSCLKIATYRKNQPAYLACQ